MHGSLLPSSPPLILLDLNGYIFRAWHALPPLSTRSGIPTQVVYGVAQMLLKLLREYPRSPMGAVMDAPGKTWREERFPEYKAHRPPAPEGLVQQIPIALELVEALGVPVLTLPGYEADDLIAALARKSAREGREVLIVSGDKDLLQLVGEAIKVFDPMRELLYTPKEVREKWGVPPARLPELLALSGDAVDGIPGVPGIGKKRALEILGSAPTLADLLADPQRIPAAYRKRVLAARERIEEGLRLITLPQPEELPLLPELPLAPPQPDWEKVRSLLKNLEFHSLLKRLPEGKEERRFLEERNIRIVTDLAEVAGLFEAEELAFDTETTSLDPHAARLVGLSIARHSQEAFYIPLQHREGGNASYAEFLPLLKAYAEDERRRKIGHNLKYDLKILKSLGIELRGIAGDTMIASYLLDPDAPEGHGLNAVAYRILQHRMITYEEVARGGDFTGVGIAEAARYSGEDALVTLRLHELLTPRLKAEGLYSLYQEIELPLIPVLAHMEWWGIRVNEEKLRALKEELTSRMAQLEQEIYEIVGHPFNLQSPRQVEAVLFDELKLSVRGMRRTKTGARTTRAEVLERLKDSHPVVAKILEHRSYAKIVQTYLEALLRFLSPVTGRIHPQFHQAVAATGRLSSSDPNLQNIPAREEWGERLRDAFEAEPGYLFLGADYSQLELRVLAHLAEEPVLMEAFQKGEDLHSATARELFHVEEVTPELRQRGKTLNFGMVYGMGAQRVAQELSIPLKEAEAVLERTFARYPRVRLYQEAMIRHALEHGYVTTLMGRKRWIPAIHSQDPRERSQAERIAINTPVQGSAADLMKLGMIRIYRILKERFPRVRLLLQVHDELLFEVPEEELPQVEPLVKEMLEQVYPLKVPLKVHLGVGETWQKAHG